MILDDSGFSSGFNAGFDNVWHTTLGVNGLPSLLYGDLTTKTVTAPIFAGTIPDISVTFNTSTYQYDYSTYFTGATSYSIAPAVEAGWSFNTGTGVLTVDTDALGTFGTYVITGTNAGGTDDSNAFSVVVAEAVVKAGGAPKRVRQRKHKQIMIDGEVHVVETPEQEYFLLSEFLAKSRSQFERDLTKKKTPIVKKKIKVLASTITRTENRIDKVSGEMKWRQKLRREDEEILTLLM